MQCKASQLSILASRVPQNHEGSHLQRDCWPAIAFSAVLSVITRRALSGVRLLSRSRNGSAGDRNQYCADSGHQAGCLQMGSEAWPDNHTQHRNPMLNMIPRWALSKAQRKPITREAWPEIMDCHEVSQLSERTWLWDVFVCVYK